ncbi:MAG: phosphatidate cytidylyltransferase, partial [Pseudomonadales bacterium]
RVLTALFLLGLTLAAIYLLPQWAFATVMGAVVLGCGWEWSRLAGLESSVARGAAVGLLALAMLGAANNPDAMFVVLVCASALWLLATVFVLRYPRDARWLSGPWVGLLGLPLLVGAWAGLCAFRSGPNGGVWLLWLFCVVWAGDVGAYFSGRRFGRRKLAPAVSPGKTWEGVVGGALLSLAVTWVLLATAGHASPAWVAVVLGLIALSIFGDLFESVLKRQRGVKDSGSLLPGHGGLLDRVDALLPVLPVFALLQPLLQQAPA